MPLLPRPYPDEIIGSVIDRACHQTGMSRKRLIQCIFGSSRSNTSFLMSGDLVQLGILTGLDAMELLEQHTMLPYAIAFMPPDEQIRLRAKALKSIVGADCLGSLTKNISHGVPFRRICPDCINDERHRYGETYWHRAHLLPAVLICAIHGTRLRVSPIPLRGHTHTNSIELPDNVQTTACEGQHDVAVLNEVKLLSIQALCRKIYASGEWPLLYRNMVVSKGYELAAGTVAGRMFSLDLHRFLGESLLTSAGCNFPLQRLNPWPSLMVRENIRIPFATPKHILIQAFFKLANNSDGEFGYPRPGRKIGDYRTSDEAACNHIKAVLESSKLSETRYTVQELLQGAGVWSAFKHDRSRFPRTYVLIQEFRSSDQSERQIGLRSRWRKHGKACDTSK